MGTALFMFDPNSMFSFSVMVQFSKRITSKFVSTYTMPNMQWFFMFKEGIRYSCCPDRCCSVLSRSEVLTICGDLLRELFGSGLAPHTCPSFCNRVRTPRLFAPLYPPPDGGATPKPPRPK